MHNIKLLTSALILSAISIGCSQSSETSLSIVDAEQLLYDIQALSHDSLEGRAMGTVGNHKAQKFIAERFKSINISPALEAGFIQSFRHEISAQRRHNMFEETASVQDVSDTTLVGGNLVAVIHGQSDSIIVVTAHLDHLGKFGHDDPNNKTQDNWTYSSDHRVFYERGIPYMYFGVEDHEDYHEPTDTFEKINQPFYVETVSFIIKAIESYDLALP